MQQYQRYLYQREIYNFTKIFSEKFLGFVDREMVRIMTNLHLVFVFRSPIDSNIFLEISRLIVLRILWYK